MKRVLIKNILEKKGVSPITCLTAYSKPIAQIIDKYCDIILVGDSLGMVLYGMKSTRNVKFSTMVEHAKAVKKSSKRSLVVFDMPYKTYENKFTAYKNAKTAIKITKCDAVKIEGGKKVSNIVQYLVKKKIPVMGHIGLLPQSAVNFKVQGRSPNQKMKILEDAKAVSESGVFAIVIECVTESLAKKITENVSVPTIGIGASKYCDGQVLVIDDVIGLSNFLPKFVKRYANVKKIIENSVKKYTKDVKLRRFPTNKNVYKIN